MVISVWRLWLFVLILMGIGNTALAQSSDLQPVLLATEHNTVEAHTSVPPAKPTQVQVALYLIALNEVSEPSESSPFFEVELFLEARWKDPRLAFDIQEPGGQRVYEKAQAEAQIGRIWWPDLQIENAMGSPQVEEQELIVSAAGMVTYKERFEVKVHAHFDLTRLPFDEQVLEIDLESFAWDNRSIQLVPIQDEIGHHRDAGNSEWHIRGADASVQNEKEIRSAAEFSELIFKIRAERESDYYLWKLVAPFLIVLALAWTVFWMTGEGISGRMIRSFVALLAIVASHRVIVGYLPRIGTITYLDAVVYLAYLFMALTILENVLIHRLGLFGKASLAIRVDETARWLVPLVFLLLSVLITLVYLA